MTDQRNLILAIVLSALVLLGWSFLSDRLMPTAGPPSVKVEDGRTVPLPKPGADHVLIGRDGGIERDFDALRAELGKALARVRRSEPV